MGRKQRAKRAREQTGISPSLPRTARLWLTLVFFLSGAAGLGYQVVWARLFSAGAGHEFPAVLAVVTAFMAGMAAGAFLFERLPARLSESSRAYGCLEIVIGLWGMITLALVPMANELVLRLLGLEASPGKQWFIVFTAVLLTLLPATAAMGATLPAIELTLTRGLKRNAVGLLYGANTGGAMAGALVSAFWLMPALGLRGTVLAFSLLNILCGAAAIFLARPLSWVEPKPAKPRALPGFLPFALLATGLLGIGFETVTIRILSHALENTVYTFAVVLAVYLGGTAMGAGLYHRQSARLQSYPLLFLALAATCLLSGLTARSLNAFYNGARSFLGDTPMAVMTSELGAALLLFLLPAIAMGATFARLAQESLDGRRTLGWAVSLNTLGAAFAPPLFGTILIPHLGLKWTLLASAVGYACLIPRPRHSLPAILVLFLAGLALPRASDLIETPPGSKIIELREGVMGSVSVIENTNAQRVLKVNNRFQMGGTAAAVAEQRHADIPLLLHPQPRSAAFLGLGTGITFATALYHPNLKADGVELVPEIAELMPLFLPDAKDPFDSPPLQTYVADARRFALTTSKRYDVVVGDLFHPAQDGTGFLYTREHFRAVREILNSRGLFCQWLPLYQMDEEVLRSIIRAFLEVFPSAEAWLLRLNINTPVLGLVGYHSPVQYQPGWVEHRLRDPELSAHLRKVALADSVRLFGLFVASAGELNRFAGAAPPNTDDRPLVIFRAPESTYERARRPYATLAGFLREVDSDPAHLSFEPGHDPFLDQLRAYMAARDIYLAGLIHEAEGRVTEAIEHYIESASVSPDFTSGYAQCVTIATALSTTNREAAREILERLARAQPDRGLARELLERLDLAEPGAP